jgi:hypothetical protein
MPRPGKAIDPAIRREAVDLANQVGSAEAVRQLAAKGIEVNPSSLRAWKSRATSTALTAPGEADDPVAQLRQEARATFAVAMDARRAASRAMHRGKTTGAKDLGVLCGVLIDQCSKLEAAAQRLDEQRVQVTEEQQQLMLAALRITFAAIGLDARPSTPVATLVGSVFRAHERDGVLVADASAAQAVRALITQQVQNRMEGEGWHPPDAEPAGDAEGPRDDVSDEEIVDGVVIEPDGALIDDEVLDELLERYSGDQQRAQDGLALWREQRPEREKREREIAAAWDEATEERRARFLSQYHDVAIARRELWRDRQPQRFAQGTPESRWGPLQPSQVANSGLALTVGLV